MFAAANPAQANANSYRPIQGYGDINLTTHNLYANYNAMQVTWARQKGHYTIQLNYAFQKAMGIVSTNGANISQANLDPFNLSNNYGVQAGNRTHVFNAAYSIELPSPIRNSKLLEWRG